MFQYYGATGATVIVIFKWVSVALWGVAGLLWPAVARGGMPVGLGAVRSPQHHRRPQQPDCFADVERCEVVGKLSINWTTIFCRFVPIPTINVPPLPHPPPPSPKSVPAPLFGPDSQCRHAADQVK